MRRFVTLLTLLGCLISCGEAQNEFPGSKANPLTVSLSRSPGAAIWQGQCSACHGAAGEGNAALGAPALIQLSSEYLARQLIHFKSGVRGAHPDDAAGKRMALSVVNLDEADVAKLATLITTELPPARPVSAGKGDAARGEDYYVNICSACHGGNAQGNDALGAPALAGLNDWYLKSSYLSYVEGVRGSHPDDFYGAQMSRLASTLAGAEDLDDIVAYIATLSVARGYKAP